MQQMKLQRQATRKVGTKEYTKWVTTISPKIIQELGWESGDTLQPTIEGHKLIIKRKEEKSFIGKKVSKSFKTVKKA